MAEDRGLPIPQQSRNRMPGGLNQGWPRPNAAPLPNNAPASVPPSPHCSNSALSSSLPHSREEKEKQYRQESGQRRTTPANLLPDVTASFGLMDGLALKHPLFSTWSPVLSLISVLILYQSLFLKSGGVTASSFQNKSRSSSRWLQEAWFVWPVVVCFL